MDKYQIGLALLVIFFVIVGVSTFILVRGSGRRFIIAGRSMPFFIVGTMFMAQATDANSTLGNAANVFTGGFWAGFQFPGGLALCMVITALFYAKHLHRMNLITLPDYYFRRYGNVVEVLVTLLMATSFIILVAGNIAGCGYIMANVFDIPLVTGMLIMVVAVFTYTLAGGLFSCAATDIVQLYPAIIAFVAGAIIMIGKVGWGTMMTDIAPEFMDLSGLTSIEHGALLNWAGLIGLGLGDVVALDFMERVFSSESPEVAQKGLFYGAFFTLIIGLAASMIGLTGLVLLPGIETPQELLPTIAMNHLPYIVGLFIMGGVIGAGLSTANGGLLGICAVMARNILQRNILAKKIATLDPKEKEKHDRWLLIATRWMGVPVMAIATLLAYYKPEPGIMLVLAFDVVFATCLVPLTLGIYWPKANAYGAIAAIIVGGISRIVMFFTVPEHLAGLDTFVPPVLSLIAMVPVSLMTQKQSPPMHHVNFETPTDEQVLAGTH